MLGLGASHRSFLVVLTLSVGLCSCKWQDIGEDFKDVSVALTRKILPIAQEALFSVDVRSQCSGALLKLLSSTREGKAWSTKFIASNGVAPVGSLFGKIGAPGHYGQCVTAKSPPGENAFQGKYCTLLLNPPEDMLQSLFNMTIENGDLTPGTRVSKNIDNDYLALRFYFGICIPSSCSGEEIADIVGYMTAKYDIGITVRTCQTLEDENHKDPMYYVAVTAAFILICLSVFAAILRSFPQFESVEGSKIFALQTAFHFLTKPVSEKDRNLAFVGGIRALMAFWVILGHTYFMSDPQATHTLKESFDSIQTYYGQFISTGGFLSVSTFFCISGFMLFHSLAEKARTHPGFSLYIVAVIRRYVRLTVPSMFVILMAMGLPSLVHGVYKNNYFTMYTNACFTDWWRVLTYSNTFATLDKMCLFHYWFMSADMQMFVALAPFVVLYVRHPRATMVFWMMCILLGCSWIIYTTQAELLPSFGFYSADWERFYQYMHLVYTRCAAHLAEFVIGIFTASLYRHHRDIKLAPGVKFISVTVAMLAALAVIEYPMMIYRDIGIPRVVDLFYAGFNRVVWASTLCWLMFLMATRNLDWMSNLLSNRILVILGRLSFATYLVHVPVMLYFMGSATTENEFTHMALIRIGLGNWIISLTCAAALYMFVESPTAQLDTLMWAKQISGDKKAKTKTASSFSVEKKADPSLGLKEIKVESPTKL